MMAVLAGRDRTFTLERTITVLGASPEADISVASPHLSRRHALVVRDRKGWLLIDYRSANGVAVNGAPIEVQRLHDGDVITLSGATGAQEVRFQFQEEPASPAPVRRRSSNTSPAEASLRVAARIAGARDLAALAQEALDELIALCGADRAAMVIYPDSPKSPDPARSFGRRRTPDGVIDDGVGLLPGPLSRLRAGQDLVYQPDCLQDNPGAPPRGLHVAMPISMVRSAVCAALRLRGTLHGVLQLERALFSEPFPQSTADLVEAVRRPLALAAAAIKHRAGAAR